MATMARSIFFRGRTCSWASSVESIRYGVDVALQAVGAYYFVPHVCQVAGEIGSVDAESDDKIAHNYMFSPLLSFS